MILIIGENLMFLIIICLIIFLLIHKADYLVRGRGILLDFGNSNAVNSL